MPGSDAGWYISALEKEYGIRKLPGPGKRPNPLDTLVLTVLSQNTNDLNRDRAWDTLRSVFPAWEDLLDGELKKISAAIRVGGLADQKARRIKAILKRIQREWGRLSLDFICSMPLPEAREYLLSLKGVGEKTATLVLLFCCGRPVFPVDTHIHRVSMRLGLIPEKTTAQKAHYLMEEIVPGDKMYGFHLNLIAHGRAVCKARKPDCPVCCLNKRCLYYSKNR